MSLPLRRLQMPDPGAILDDIGDECAAHEAAGDATALAAADGRWELGWDELGRPLERQFRHDVARTAARLQAARLGRGAS